MRQRIYVTEKHIKESDVCPHDCMVANAMKDAGFTNAIVDGSDFYASMDDEIGVKLSQSLKDTIYKWDCSNDPVEPFYFDVWLIDSEIVEFGEVFNMPANTNDCAQLIGEIEALLAVCEVNR